MSCAYVGYIYVFNSFKVCDNIKVHEIIKVEKEDMDASKEE